MKYYLVEPPVGASIGDETVVIRTTWPPTYRNLHAQIEGWTGDALIQGFGFFLITTKAKSALLKLGTTGIQFGDVKVTKSDLFKQLQRNTALPRFLRAKIHGKAKIDDFANDESGGLIVSDRALKPLKKSEWRDRKSQHSTAK